MNIKDIQLVILHALLQKGDNYPGIALKQSYQLAKQFIEDIDDKSKEDTS